jgi:hypothetical protein
MVLSDIAKLLSGWCTDGRIVHVAVSIALSGVQQQLNVYLNRSDNCQGMDIHLLWVGVLVHTVLAPASRFLADVGDCHAPKKPEILRSNPKQFTIHSYM